MIQLSQIQIQILFNELLKRIDAKYSPINVTVQPEIGAKPSNCFNNVARKVAKEGGSIVYGWALLPQRHILEAEKHAIWKMPDGEYVDITPRPFPIPMLQFVIDDEFEYKGQLVGNVRINTTQNIVVDDWIFVCEAIDELYTHTKRVDDQYVDVPPPIAPFLNWLENFVKNYEPYVTAGGGPDTLCFCGKPFFYKDCHGSGMQEAINNDLAQVLESLRKV
ncbi:hypothetical protein [Mucilaginibacter psychrotolerans]|uniref:Uncharacterized protein n=1 Tax=Mucilaginibacter psychrotolerans TaxID=1524096 RepID=A0A4Y8SG24_9SPHI|nr:hypothetical protein [Mucilaginibacter psychrotolerans]TFF37888.1 hypothetical protein E2R66_09870 [Mucilaginibacter psychrotolerans]